jgi:hypothetical protein
MFLLGATALAGASPRTSDEASPDDEATRPRIMLGVGISAGYSGSGRQGLTIDLSRQLGEGAYYAHAQLGMGTAGFEGRNRFVDVRGGVELRDQRQTARLIGGIDLGYQNDFVDRSMMTTREPAFVAVPRLGVELGHDIRARAIVEVPIYMRDVVEVGLLLGLAAALAF